VSTEGHEVPDTRSGAARRLTSASSIDAVVASGEAVGVGSDVGASLDVGEGASVAVALGLAAVLPPHAAATSARTTRVRVLTEGFIGLLGWWVVSDATPQPRSCNAPWRHSGYDSQL
jgi:hypothetical protein